MKSAFFPRSRHPWAYFLSGGLIVGGILLMSPLPVLAQTSSDEVFDRVENNLTHARANREDSQKNLETINQNLAQVFKAREHLNGEAGKVQSELQNHLKKLEEAEKLTHEVQRYEEQEKVILQNEEARIAELEAALGKLRTSAEQRRQKLATANQDREKMQSQLAEWKSRTESLQKLNQEAKSRNDRLNAEEKEWSTKKISYEKDIERWNKLVQHQEKVKANLTALKAQ